MKRTIALLLTALLYLGCYSGVAETQISKVNSAGIFFGQNDPMATRAYSTTPVWHTNAIHVYVTYVYHDMTGAVSEVRQNPQVVNVQYKYFVDQNQAGDYIGGEVARGDYPKVTVRSSAPSMLEVSCERIAEPVVTGVTGNGSTYTVTIRGGGYTITYNNRIEYDAQGNVIDVDSTTVTRAYSFTKTGTLD